MLAFENGSYRTKIPGTSFFSKVSPSFFFYWHLLPIVFSASAKAKRKCYDDNEWFKSSLAVLRSLEHTGISIEITGIDNLLKIEGPCVLIANHMSTLETFLLPSIIGPYKRMTFIVKQSLVEYPVFRHVMRSRDPITVGRSNPRDDLRAVLEGGAQRLGTGVSIVVFPQTTRTPVFNPQQFNTIGVKLAKKAGVPIIPVALKSDAWGNGRLIKELGKIDPSRTVYFAFGEPFRIKDRGTEEHQNIIRFIQGKLGEWL